MDSELVDGLGVMQTNCFRALVVGLGLLVSASYGADPAKPDSGSNAVGLRAIAIGEKVPDFSFVNTVDGKTYRLSNLQKDNTSNSSGVVVLTFWCSFCGSCRHVEHALNKLAMTYKGRVAVIALDASAGETIEGIREFKRDKKLTFPVVFDSTGHTADLLGTKVTTTTLVIDAKGVLRYRGQFQVRASGSGRGRRAGGSFLSRFDVSKFDVNSDGRITRSEIKSKLHQRVYDRMVKEFKLESTKSYQLTEFRKAIGRTPNGKSVAGGKKLTATIGKKASADPQAVIALKAVLAGKNVKVTETALRG